MTHRAPGLAGAVLSHDEVTAELICDGFHVHPAMSRLAIARQGRSRRDRDYRRHCRRGIESRRR